MRRERSVDPSSIQRAPIPMSWFGFGGDAAAPSSEESAPLLRTREGETESETKQTDSDVKLLTNGFCLLENPARYARVIGKSDREQGPKLVNKPLMKTITNVQGLGDSSP